MKYLNMLFVLLSLVAFCGVVFAQTWQYEYPVPTGGAAGLWASMKRDTLGNLRVAYVGHGMLMYATRTTAWTTEVANANGVSSGEAPQWTSLALYGSIPHISYYDARTRTLKHAWKSGTWQSETVDSTSGVGKHSCIAVNNAGYPAIVYYDETNNMLKYAYQDSSGWHISSIAIGCGKYSSLAFDTSGNAHVVYYDAGYTLKYAKRSAGSWSYETADGTQYRGEMCSLTLDSSGYPHVAYRDVRLGHLRYAWKDASGWRLEVVDSQEKSGFVPSIAIGTDGNPRIVYFRNAGYVDGGTYYHGQTWFARKVGTWQKQLIQHLQTTSQDWCMSLVLDSSDRPCVAYHYFASRSLNYMYYTGSAWVQEIADAGREIGEYASIAIDSSDNLHLSYYAMDNPNLFYAKKSGSSWYSEIVDNAGDTGGFSSIALLPSGYPAIAYAKFNTTYNDPYTDATVTCDLKYAYRDATAWRPSTLQTNAGTYISLTISGGYPRISYGDHVWKGSNLRYAQWNGSSWEFAIVDAGKQPTSTDNDWHADGLWTSVAFDSSGNPHISYMEIWEDVGSTPAEDVFLTRLMHAWRTGGTWQKEIVDDGSVGRFSSLAFDPSGYPCIAYHDTQKGVLKYARKTASGWVKEVVDTTTATGWWASLAFDSFGYPRIAYKEIGGQALKYAWKDTSGWKIETADNSGRVGNYCDLALSSNNEPYIVYMDWDNLTLKVAYQRYSKITGYVRSETGEPLSGATVTTNPRGYSAVTGSDGSYIIKSVFPGVYDVTAWKTGYPAQTQKGINVPAGQTVTVNFSLPVTSPGTISGAVSDSNGNVIVGANISTDIGGYSATSGSNGGYSMSAAPGAYAVTASKTGYQSQSKSGVVVISGQVTSTNFSLVPITVGTIAGTVTNTSGVALGGVSINVSPGGYSTSTASDGTFSLSNVPAGNYTVAASKTGYQSQSQTNIVVVAAQITTCNFVMAPVSAQLVNGNFEGGFTGGVANGWTKHIRSGSPTFTSETANVHGGTYAQKWYTSGQTHDACIYQQIAVSVGISYTFSAWTWRHDDWNNGGDNEATWVGVDTTGQADPTGPWVQWSSKQVSYHSWTQQSITAIAEASVITVFIRGRAAWGGSSMITVTDDAVLQTNAPGVGIISGYVRDSSGSAIGGTFVNTSTGGYTAMSATDGSYTLQNVVAGTYTVIAARLGYQSQSKSGIIVSAGQTTSCSFNLVPTHGAISGYVKDTSNNPISGATVSTSPGDYSAVSATNGSYTISCVPPGVYVVTAYKPGYALQTKTGISVSAGQATTVNFNLSSVSTGTISGYVRDAGGSALPGATVSTNIGGYSTIAGSSGAYSLTVAPGIYNVTASKSGCQSQTHSGVSVGAGQVITLDFNLVCVLSGKISGYVRSISGSAIVGATVSTNIGGYSTTTGSDGAYSLSVAPGTYDVTASRTNYQSQTKTGIYVSAGQTVILDFSLTPIVGTITGVVKSTSGSPISGATVSTDIGGYSATSGSDGGYLLMVAPDTYTVTAVKNGFQSRTQSGISVAVGQTVQVDFILTSISPGVISGVVRSASGSTISGATVTTDVGGYSSITGSGGEYSLSVASGTYAITASKSGYQSQIQANIAVSGSETVTCNFHLLPTAPQLINGDFEGGFTSGLANGWTKFVTAGSPAYVEEKTWIHGGTRSQRWWTDYATHDAGVYQQVSALSGASYIFSAWTWRHDAWNNGTDNEATWVGIDPNGGTSATSPNVQWSTSKYSYETWTQQTVTAVAQSTQITVFVRGRANWAGHDMIAVVDDASLTGGAPAVGAIRGYVRDVFGRPIGGAMIQTTAGGYTAMSGSDGAYILQNVLPGSYSVGAYKALYQSQTKTGIAVTAYQTTFCDFVLVPNYTVYTRISEAKKQLDGQFISIAGVVCSRRPSNSILFVQDADRTAGIKVVAGAGSIPSITSGTVCTVSGRLASSNNVRHITDVQITVGASGPAPNPLLTKNLSIGGADFFYSPGPPASGQKGASWGRGANNVGLLVSVWGRVLNTPVGGVFHISGGSLSGGLPIKMLDWVAIPPVGTFCFIRGIAEPDGLLLVSESDIISL